MGHGGADGYVLDGSVKQRCGTCDFWGGPRRLTEDGKTVTITGLGWCNNPKSRNYQKITSPEHGPMAVWRRWSLIPWQASARVRAAGELVRGSWEGAGKRPGSAREAPGKMVAQGGLEPPTPRFSVACSTN